MTISKKTFNDKLIEIGSFKTWMSNTNFKFRLSLKILIFLTFIYTFCASPHGLKIKVSPN